MKILFPDNIFAKLLYYSLNEELQKKISFGKPSELSPMLLEKKADAALISSFDLIKHRGLFVSKKIGISFNGSISNAYYYFIPNQNDISDLYLSGDVTSLEVILTKIVFQEAYGTEVEIHLTESVEKKNINYMLVGDINLAGSKFATGLSFVEEVIELISFPLVNFILAAFDDNILNEIHKQTEGISERIGLFNNEYINRMRFDEETRNFLSDNLNGINYEFSQTELNALTEMLKLPYYYGMVDDLFEVNFI